MKQLFASVLCLAACLALTGCFGKDSEVDLNAMMGDIEAAYGDDWLANSEMSQSVFENEFGLEGSLVDSYVGRMPMTGNHPDRVLLIKATKDNGEAVEQALRKRLNEMIADATQNPDHTAKLNSARVVRNGDYVGLLMVGAEDTVSGDDKDAALQFAKDQVKKAEDVFHGAFQ